MTWPPAPPTVDDWLEMTRVVWGAPSTKLATVLDGARSLGEMPAAPEIAGRLRTRARRSAAAARERQRQRARDEIATLRAEFGVLLAEPSVDWPPALERHLAALRRRGRARAINLDAWLDWYRGGCVGRPPDGWHR